MSQEPKNSLDQLIILISEVNQEEVKEERKELESQGVNFNTLDSKISDLLKNNKTSQPSWLLAAKAKKQKADEIYERAKLKMKENYSDMKEFVTAIKSGKYGEVPKQKLIAQFRGRDESQLSEKELRDLLRDCDLLKMLKGDSND